MKTNHKKWPKKKMEKITLNFPSNQHIAHINGISLVKLKTNKSPNNFELMAPNQPCSQLLIEKKVWLADALGSRWAAGISLGRSIVLVLFGILSASSFFSPLTASADSCSFLFLSLYLSLYLPPFFHLHVISCDLSS